MTRLALVFLLLSGARQIHASTAEESLCSKQMEHQTFVWGALGLSEVALGFEGPFLNRHLGGQTASEFIARSTAQNFLRELSLITLKRDLTVVEAADLVRSKIVWLDYPFLFPIIGSALMIHGINVLSYLRFQSILIPAVREIESDRPAAGLERLRVELFGAINGISKTYVSQRRLSKSFTPDQVQQLKIAFNRENSGTLLQEAIARLTKRSTFCRHSRSITKKVNAILSQLLITEI